MSTFDFLPLGILILILVVMLHPKVRDSAAWRATVTPLASIIGSGFLIVAPLLVAAVGTNAVVAICSIIALALWVGGAIRYNIRRDGQDLISMAISGVAQLERIADAALAVAYVISISFYLRLMAAFVLDGVGAYSDFNADIVAVVLVMFIGLYGWRNGLYGLERLEEYSVTVKLSIIGALLIWLMSNDWTNGYDLSAIVSQGDNWWEQLRLLGGMLLIVQGFETSKYLGSTYSRDLRAKSMFRAQIVAGIIYLVFVTLSLPLMAGVFDGSTKETAIIDLTAQITPILPVLLIIAAVMSQFSAAVADTIGAGGVVERESSSRISIRTSYLMIATASSLLIMLTHIFELVAIASRVFAFYYFLQAILATRLSWAFEQGSRKSLLSLSHALLALLMLLIFIFGKAVEG